MEIYLRSIDRRWRKELHAPAAGVQVFSPYITSKTADSVLGNMSGGQCEVTTLFEMDVFAAGASSLSTLTKLMDQGHRLFHLPNLHAKLVYVPSHFASIGSQNLTSRGTRNKEATIAIDDAGHLREVEASIGPWLEERLPITRKMIADMEELLPPVRRLYLAAQTAAESADAEMSRRRAERSGEHARRMQVLMEQARRRLLVENAVDRAPKSRQVSVGTVKTMESEKDSWETGNYSFSTTKSLVVGRDADLTTWWIDGKRVDLVPRNRYLCVHQNGRKLGWARVGKTRITYVGKNVTRTDTVWLDGQRCVLTFTADWSSDPEHGRNATVTIKHQSGNAVCVVSIWFSVDDMLQLDVEPAEGGRLAEATKSAMVNWVRQNPIDFRETVLPRFVSPFLYEERLRGVQATEFFGPLQSRYQLRLLQTEGNAVLTVNAV
jgi:hypothetical protein